MSGCGCGQRKMAEEKRAEEPVESAVCSVGRDGYISKNRMKYDVGVGIGVGILVSMYSHPYSSTTTNRAVAGFLGLIIGTFLSNSASVGKRVSGMMFDRECGA